MDNRLEEKPKDLLDLEKGIQEIHSYRNAVQAATFPGKEIISGASLLKFLNDSFKQLQDAHKIHPWIKKAVELAEAAKAELAAKDAQSSDENK